MEEETNQPSIETEPVRDAVEEPGTKEDVTPAVNESTSKTEGGSLYVDHLSRFVSAMLGVQLC